MLGLGCSLLTGTAWAGFQVVGYAPSAWGTSDAAIGLAGYTIEDFEDTSLATNLLVGCESAAGNLIPTNVLPNRFDPLTDSGLAFVQGNWEGSHCLVNTRDNQAHSYAESQHWGTMMLEFPSPVKSVGFSVQQLNYDVRLLVNGTELGGLAALSGLVADGGRQGYVRIDATGTNTIATIRLTSVAGFDGWVIDHLAFTASPPPFQLTGSGPAQWGTSDWALGVAGWWVEAFEGTNLAPHLLVGCESAAGSFGPADALPNLFNPTNDANGTAYQGAPWDGSHGLLNTRDNQSHPYTDTTQWGDIVLQFTVPMRSVAFGLQQMETSARLVINGADLGALTTLSGLSVSSGRNGFIRIDAAGTNAITSIKLDNATGDGFVLDHLAYAPAGVLAAGSAAGLLINTYAAVTDPESLSFAPDGTLFTARDATGSGGGSGDAVKVHRIGAGGSPVAEYGNTALYDPDGVCFDPAGSISGVAGAVLVAGWSPSGNVISAIRPDQTILTVLGPTSNFDNPDVMKFDRTGRLLIQSYTSRPGLFVLPPGGAMSKLITLPGSVDPDGFAVSPDDRVFVLDENGVLRVYAADGALLSDALATGLHSARFEFAPGGPFGTDLWLVKTNGDLLRFDSAGVPTTIATGLPPRLYDLAFGADGAMYLSDFLNDRVLRVTVAHNQWTKWPVGQGGNDHWYAAVLVGTNGINFNQASNAAVSLQGHLATITSEAENTFVLGLIPNPAFWYLDPNNGEGPWIGGWQPSGSSEPSGGWRWVTDETWSYAHWSGGEPNNNGGTEDRACFFGPGSLMGTVWNDVPHDARERGYIAECERFPAIPVITSRDATFKPGQPIQFQLVASGAPRAFSVQDLPAGLTCDPATGLISGTATNTSPFRIQVVAANGIGASASATVAFSPVASALFNLAADWSTNTNPNGVWSLYKSETALFTVYQPGYGWADDSYPAQAHVPVWARAASGTNLWAHGAELDRTGSDTTKARWTSPANGVAVIQGSIWMPLDQGRRMGWQLRKNGTVLTSGEVYSGDPYDFANPFRFELGAAGPAALTQSVFAGDYLELALISLSDSGNLAEGVSIDFRVELNTTAAVPPAGLVAWWPADGDARDPIGLHHGVPINGAGYTNGFNGQAFKFDGSNDQVIVPDADDLDLTNALTLAAWVKVRVYQNWGGIISKGEGNQLNYGLNSRGDGRFKFSLAYGQETVISLAHGVDEWHFVAGTWDGTNARIYVDGVLEGTTPFAGSLTPNSSRLFLGADPAGATEYFNGLVDEAAIWNRALSSTEISVLYTAGNRGMSKPVCEPPPAGLADWWSGDGNPDDVVGVQHGSLRNHTTYAVGKVGAAFDLDGVDDFVEMPSLASGATAFSFCTWLRVDSFTHSKYMAAFCESPPTFISAVPMFALFVGNGSKDFGFEGHWSDGTLFDLRTAIPFGAGVWKHVAVTYDGAVLKQYVDGTLLNQGNYTGKTLQADFPFLVGKGYAYPYGVVQTNYFDGRIDELQYFTRALTADEIGVLFTADRAGLCRVTQVLNPPRDLVAWWPCDGNALDPQGQHHGTLLNGVGTTNGMVRQALSFDGSNDQVDVPSAGDLDLTNALTVAAWVKPHVYVEWGGIISKGENSKVTYSLNSKGDGRFKLSLAFAQDTVVSLAHGVDEWHFVAGTWDGTNARIYVDGVQEGSTRFAGPLTPNSGGLFIGADPTGANERFNGLIDEAMVCRRALSSHELLALYEAGSAGMRSPGSISPPSALAAWWPGDGSADDVVGWNDGWLVGGTSFTNGIVDQCFVFNSDDDRVMIPHSETLDVSTNGFTVEFWMKADKNQPDTLSAIVEKSHGYVDSTGWAFHVLRADGKLTFIIGRGGAGASDFASVATLGDVLDNQFHHIAGVWDKTNLMLYVDGSLQGATALAAPANNTRSLNFAYAWGDGTPQRFYRGLLDEVALYPRALSADEVEAIAAASSSGRVKPTCISAPANLVAWLPGEGNADDRASGLNGTLGAGATFTDGRVGRAFHFVDATDSQVTLPDATAWLPANDQFTIQAWIKPDFTIIGDQLDTILSKRDACSTISYHFGVLRGHRGYIGNIYFTVDNPRADFITEERVPDDGQFHHVVATYNGSLASGNMCVYLDGRLVGMTNHPGSIPVTASAPAIGRHCSGSSYYSSADMDEIAFFQRALSVQEIAALYGSGSKGICKADAPLSPPTGQVAWWRAEYDARDVMGYHHGTLQNGITFTNGVAGSAFSLDGVNDGIVVPGAEALNISSNGFTVELWMRGLQNQSDSQFCVIEKSHGWVDSTGWMVQGDSASGRLGFAIGGGGGGAVNFVGASSVAGVLDGRFHHVAGTWDGGAIRFYVDGQLQETTVFTTPFNNTRPLNIGFTWGNGTPRRYFRGVVDEVGVYQRALSSGEIRAIVEAGVLGKEPPECVLPPGGLSAWWPADGDFLDLAGRNSAASVGGVTFTESMVNQGWHFDGTNQEVVVADSPELNPTEQMTIATWVRFDSLDSQSYYPGVQYLVFKQNSRTTSYTEGYVLAKGRYGDNDHFGFTCAAADGTQVSAVGTTAIVVGQWYHVVATYDRAAVRLYVNGVLEGQQAASFSLDNGHLPLHIGTSGIPGADARFAGALDELAIYHRALDFAEVAALYAAGSAGMCRPQCVQASDGLVAWWRGEGDGRDVTGNHHGTPENGLAFADGVVGRAFELDASSSTCLRVPNHPSLNCTNITLAAWVKPFSYPTLGCAILRKQAGASAQYLLQLGTGNNAGLPTFNCGISGTQPRGSTPLPLNQWSHVVGTYDGNEARVYVDGMLVDARPLTGPMPVTTHDLFIGRLEDDSSRNFDGLIDEVAIWNRALSVSEVAALHATGIEGMCLPQCAPPPDGMSHWFKAESTTGDAVGGLTGTLEGGATFAMSRVGQGFSFDGANDLVTCTNFPNLGTNSFSVALWYRSDTTSASAGNMKLVNKGMTAYGTPEAAGFQIRLQGSALNFRLNDEAGLFSETAAAEPAVGVWHHVAAVADRTNKLIQLYVDGALAAETNYTTLGSIDTNVRLAIGALDRRPGSSALAEFFDGLIDEVLFFDRPLTGNEVASLHAAGSAGICPTIRFDATSAFTIANGNPNGVWSYGWMPTDFSTFNLDTVGEQRWHGPAWSRVSGGEPVIWKNTTTSTQWGVPVGWLSLHPGGGNIPSVLRWTAPAPGVAHVVGQFLPAGAVLPVAVRLNGQPWWTAPDYGSFDLTSSVSAGSTIDFAVYGGYISGNTPLEANITLALSETFPPTILVQPTNQVVTATRDVALAVNAFGSEPLHYQWCFTNAPLAGATDAVLVLPLVTTNQAGTYFAIVSNFVGAVTSQWAVLTVLPDTVGPIIANFTPSGTLNTDVTRLTVEFAERVNTNTFTVADVAVVAPGGALNSSAFTLQPIAPFNNNTFEVLIPAQTAEGLYQVQIGPQIQDYTGNAMDSAFAAQFTLDKTGPAVANVTPSGVVSNTITHLDVDLDSAYAPASLSAADVVIAGVGAPAVNGVTSRGATGFRATLASPMPQGDFTISIGPNINDTAGNPMGAAFHASLTVLLPDLAVRSIAAPVTALAGQPLNFAWTVTNRGPGNVTGAWKSRVQLATDANGAGAITLGTFTATNLLAATTACSPTGNIILPATAAGDRWLMVTADCDQEVFENTETNNTLVAAMPITLLTPDLALASFSAPASAQFGQTLNVSWAVTNVGTAPASAAWSDRVYLSTASNSISGATPLATVAAEASPLQAGQGYAHAANVSLPFSAQSVPGAFWLVAAADYANAQAEASEGNNLRSVPVTLGFPPLPDLAVTRVIAPTNTLPNQAFNVSWSVTNRGSAMASGVWSETLIVTNTVTGGAAQALFTFTNTLAAGQSLSRTQAVTLPLNGPAGDLAVLVLLDSRNEIIESAEANNLAAATNWLSVPLVITLQLPVSSAIEGTSGLQATVTRNGATGSGSLTVAITNSDSTELSTPATVIIPAEVATASFAFSAFQDDLLDGPQFVTIGASAIGRQPVQAMFTVLDANVPSLSLMLDTNVVREGQVINATVTRDLVTSGPLFVSLASSAISQLSVQESVTIPADEASASFLVFATDDSLVEPAQSYELGAAAAGFNSALAGVLIYDNDSPSITLTLASPVISENAGSQATVATVTRSPATAQPLVLQLESTNTGAALVPATVTFGAYQTNTSFAIAAVNDALLDGTQSTEIRAWIADSTSGARLALGARAPLDVTDDDGPALGLTINPKLVKEGLATAATVTVTRNTPVTNALAIILTSSDLSEATVPSGVTIPIGQVSTTAPLASVADGVNDGNQAAIITATAAGFAPASATVTVSDSDLPDLFVASVAVPASGETESYVNVTYRVANQGFVPTAGAFTARAYLSRDNLVGDDTLVGQYRFNGSLTPGQYFEQTLPVRLPQTAGDYWIVVQTDVEGEVAESLEDNNVAVSLTPIHAAASYSAHVETTVTTALANTPVPLAGRATNEFGVGAAYKLVNIHIRVRGTERIIAALTDADGNFSTTFQPLPNEAGSYQVFATHPGVSAAPVQDTFSLLGMKASAPGTVGLKELSSVTGTIVLENLSDVPLTGLAVSVTGKPSNVEVSTSLAGGTTLGGLITKQLGFVLTALDASYTYGSIVLHVTSLEGAELDIVLGVTIEPLRARLVAYPTDLVAGMVRGRQTTVEFDVVNAGGLGSGPIQVVVPVTGWLQVVSTNPLPSLEPGETNHVSLLLSPPANLPLSPYTGSLALNGTNTGISVPFSFRAISDAKGDLLVRALDEYTYYAEGAPRVTNAAVMVSDPVTHSLITNGVTDVNGEYYLPMIAEGYYEVAVSADKHQGYRHTTFIGAGLTNVVEAFLARETVRYIWTVVPTQIEDRTRITIETVFETAVPVPVVTIEPTVIDLADIQADETQIEMRVSNHGLIAANNFRLFFDSHPLWSIEPLISDLGSLPANSTLTIPVMIRRVTEGRAGTTTPSCGFGGGAAYDLVCGKTNTHTTPVAVINASTNCGGVRPAAFHSAGNGPGTGSGGGGGGGGGGGSSGSSYVTTISYVPPTICDCDDFEEFCLSTEMGFELGAIGEKLSSIIEKACPPTLKVQGVDVAIKLSGELCTCCTNGNLSFRGKTVGSAEVTVTLRGGLSVSGDLEFEAPGFTDIKAEADAMLGIELVVKGSVSILYEKPCGGDPYLCLGGSLSLTPFAGTKAMVDLQASSLSDAFSWGGKCEMAVGVTGTLEAGIFGCSNGKFGVYACGELGSLCNMSCALTAQDGLGNTLTNGFNGNADYEWIRRSCVTSGSAPLSLSGPVRKGRDPLPDLGPVTEELPGDTFFKPEAEVMRKLGWNDAAMSGICARVKLRIDQEAVISRDAFKATLEVVNDSGSLLNNVSVDVVVQDATGADSTVLFGLRPPQLSGISAVNGSGIIAPASTGKAEWIIVPTSDAAPNEPVEYWVSGTLRYLQDGLEVRVPLAPAPITVYPNPRLFVKYFHERDVYSDDPFTDTVEPSVPFNLAVMVENRGKGDARNMRITSAQPEIVENERGLLIDFQIIATEVAGKNLTPSLTADFGTITNGQIAVGRWLLTSTLQGLFIDYKASFEHLDSLGNKKLSLIEEVTIHEMIRLVRAQGALDDGKFDFLVNEVPDAEDLPDTIYLSDGTTNTVDVLQQADVDAPPAAGHLQVQLTAYMPGGWVYLRVPEPGDGQFILKRVVRSDGREILFGTNAWTTDRTFIGFGRRPVYENLFHLLDHDSTGIYTLYYEMPPAPDTTAPVSSVAALPAATPELFQVQWTGADDAGEVAGYDVFVSANGGAFLPWLQRTKQTTAAFQGVLGAQYAFFSVAVDAAGNREAAPDQPDAYTSITLTNFTPVITPVGNRAIDEGVEFVLTPTVSDGNPGDVLTFSLVSGPPGLALNPATGEMRWLTSEGLGPSTNTITWRVRDNGVPQKLATDTFTLIVNEVNTAPVMGAITNRTVMEGRLLSITNTVLDADLPPQTFTWSLAAGAPAGVGINSASGLLTWRPTEFQGGTTNPITLVVRDNGPGSLGATQTFLVTVLDTMSDFVIELGTTNVLAGASGGLPLQLTAGVPLTNVAFTLLADETRLTNLVWQPLRPELTVALLRTATNTFAATLEVAGGNTLFGSMNLAELRFGTIFNMTSAVVQVDLTNVLGISATGTPMANPEAAAGRVFIIGVEPILSDLARSNQLCVLTLYGQPGTSYWLQSATNLSGAPWRTERTVTFDTTWQRVGGLPAAAPDTYYRLVEVLSAGALAIRVEAGQSVIEWTPSRPSCKLEEATVLGATTAWTEVTGANIVLTNGIARVTLSPAGGTKFYRLRCD